MSVLDFIYVLCTMRTMYYLRTIIYIPFVANFKVKIKPHVSQ